MSDGDFSTRLREFVLFLSRPSFTALLSAAATTVATFLASTAPATCTRVLATFTHMLGLLQGHLRQTLDSLFDLDKPFIKRVLKGFVNLRFGLPGAEGTSVGDRLG